MSNAGLSWAGCSQRVTGTPAAGATVIGYSSMIPS